MPKKRSKRAVHEANEDSGDVDFSAAFNSFPF